jgi:hypothetical protein
MGVLLMAGLVGLSTSDRILTSYAIDCLYQKSRQKGRGKEPTRAVHLPRLPSLTQDVKTFLAQQEGR